ncbi:MAG: ABC transporter permease, partial [Burkholderiales bacterium]|nr:ABC transporter permease [Burkholderiales bacterium]
LAERLSRWAPTLVLAALVLAFSLANPRFLELHNFSRISIAAVPALMVALGVTFIIIMGSIDLSMEGTVSATAVLFALAFKALGGSLLGWGWLAIALALLAGAAIGLVNGLVHVKLRIPTFMASLAIGFVAMGLSVVLTSGDIVRVDDDTFRALLFVRFADFPLMFYVALALVLVAWFIERNTTLGRNFYAVGGGEDLAHASGLNVKRVRVLGFVLAGVFYAIGAIFAVARGGMAESLTGSNYMFLAITSVVVGGTSLMGGNGGVWNTVVGVLIVNVINNGMVVIGLPNYVQNGVLGVLVILAVVLSTNRRSSALVK